MVFPAFVKIVEVGARDGLQNESQIVTTPQKVAFINKLSETGLKTIEVTSFVSPKWVPQMADSYEVFQQINKKENISYTALVPNLIGLEKAMEVGVEEIAIFCTASNIFSQKNINATIAESLKRYEQVIDKAKDHGMKVRAYISCVLGCPYEGEIKPEKVAQLAEKLMQMGCYEISLGDTIGVGTPFKTKILIDHVLRVVPLEHIAVHFHDTYGQALANIYAVLEEGIAIIDSSVAGLGGCPFAKGAHGNVASEDVVYLLHGLNIQTGIDLISLCKAGIFISNHLNRTTQSKAAKTLAAKNFNPTSAKRIHFNGKHNVAADLPKKGEQPNDGIH